MYVYLFPLHPHSYTHVILNITKNIYHKYIIQNVNVISIHSTDRKHTSFIIICFYRFFLNTAISVLIFKCEYKIFYCDSTENCEY